MSASRPNTTWSPTLIGAEGCVIFVFPLFVNIAFIMRNLENTENYEKEKSCDIHHINSSYLLMHMFTQNVSTECPKAKWNQTGFFFHTQLFSK